ncbi:MAG TPA: ribonuclease P protein component, partial [Ktedonobacterales bacterium]
MHPTRIRGDERFRRTQRLRSSRDFQHVRQRGRSQGGQLLSVGYTRLVGPPTQERDVASLPSRVGFSVSKRVGGAVVRNLVKRRLRESIWRGLSRLAPGWDIVITAR